MPREVAVECPACGMVFHALTRSTTARCPQCGQVFGWFGHEASLTPSDDPAIR